MAKDPYTVLDVPRHATQDQVTKAYRGLAKKLHPDLNPGDKAAEDRFKEVSAAYGILGDPERRARFDRGEIDASGQERPQQQYYREYAGGADGARYRSNAGFEDLGGFSDLFGDLFGQRGKAGGHGFSARGQDARYRLDVDFLDAVKGEKQRITLPDGGTIDVNLPPGVADGQTIRLKGKGHSGLGEGAPGDALVEIGVRPHPLFRREGNDILIDLPISFDEAVLGAKVEAPTVGGRVTITVPAGANTGQTLRLKGRGVKTKSGATGDQLVRLSVSMPNRVDEELRAFAETWRQDHAYDPRRKLKGAV